MNTVAAKGFPANEKEPLHTPKLQRKNKEPINQHDRQSYVEIDYDIEPARTDFKAICIIGTIYFLSSLTLQTIAQSAYAYLRQVDPTRPDEFFHIMYGLAKLAQVFVLVLCSFVTNRFNNYRIQLACGRVLSVIGLLIYFTTEMFPETSRRWVLLLSFVLVGFSEGTLVIIRGYGPKFSTTADRSGAMGILTGAGLGGILFGPMINLVFSIVGRQNLATVFGVGLKLFTIPVIVLIFFNCLALVFIYYVREPEVPSSLKQPKRRLHCCEQLIDNLFNFSSWFNEKMDGIDGRLLAICLALKAITAGSFFAVLTGLMQHMMATFNMSTQDNVKWLSVNQIIAGTFAGLVATLFTVFKLGTRRWFRPPLSLIYAFLLFACMSLLTFNWPFATPLVIYDSVSAQFGCNSALYTWCSETALIEPFLWMMGGAVFLGFSMPLSLIAQDTMYSRVLEESKRQDLFQGLYAMVECFTLFVVPNFSGKFYIILGPVKFYAVIGAVQIIAAIAFAFVKSKFDRLLVDDVEGTVASEASTTVIEKVDVDTIGAYKYVPTQQTLEALIARH